jgi:hypothetical protein
MHMSTVLSASVLHRGVQGVEAPIAVYDDPSERQRLRLIGVDGNLNTVGVHKCKPIDRATLVALDLQTVAVACYPPATGRHARRRCRGARPSPLRAFGPRDEQNRARQCRARLARGPRRPITMGPSASTGATRCRSRGGRHDARPVGGTSRGAAFRDARGRRPLSARPILSGGSQSVRWAQHASRLGLRSRSDLALSHARQRG